MDWRHRAAVACAVGSLIAAGTVGVSISGAQAATPCGSRTKDIVDTGEHHTTQLWYHNCLTVGVFKRGHLGAVSGGCVSIPGGGDRFLVSVRGQGVTGSASAC